MLHQVKVLKRILRKGFREGKLAAFPSSWGNYIQRTEVEANLFRWNIRKNFSKRVDRHWNGPPREMMESPPHRCSRNIYVVLRGIV